jgi:DNA polymerase phi
LEQTAASAAAAEADEEASDEEAEDADAAKSDGSDDVESEDDSDDAEDEDDEDDDGDVDPAFRQRVAEALQVSGMGIDGNADGDVDSDEESEVWDDERMMQVDEQLAAVFKERSSTTTKRTDLKSEPFALASVSSWLT